MTYTTGTITSATPNTAIITTVETAQIAAGWQFVEEYATGQFTYRIMRCPGTLNTFGQDFYVMSRRYTTGSLTSVWWTTFEAWDTTGKRVIRYIPSLTSLLPSQAAGPFKWAVNDTAGIQCSDSMNLQWPTPPINTTGFSYFLHVSRDHFQLGILSSGSPSGIYIGLFDTLLEPADEPFPLCQLWLSSSAGSAQSYSGFTREPLQTTAVAGNFQLEVSYSASSYQQYGVQCPLEGFYQKPILSRPIIVSQRGYSTYFRGLPKDMLAGSVPGSPAQGDTITQTFDAVTKPYVFCSGAAGHTFWMLAE